MHPRFKGRIEAISAEKTFSKDSDVVLQLKVMALVSEVGFNRTGIAEFRKISEIVTSVPDNLSKFPPDTASGIVFRLAVAQEMRRAQVELDNLIEFINGIESNIKLRH